MYEVLLELYTDMQYKKYTIEDLKELEALLKQFEEQYSKRPDGVIVKKVKVKEKR